MEAARRLLLDAQGLLADPAEPATPARVRRAIERMGLVQVDTINVVERAHHHILMSRFDSYRPATLKRLLERDRSLFEHFTHDASILPTPWLRYWGPRFRWFAGRREMWNRRLGKNPSRTLTRVMGRIRREGPLRSRDFEDVEEQGPRGGFWNWKPDKAALDFLWLTGRLAVAGRDGFEKRYDLRERVLPPAEKPAPSAAAHLDWLCRASLERLGVATPAEIAGFLDHVTSAPVAKWCRRAAARGEIRAVRVASLDGREPRAAFAVEDWRERAARAPDPPERTRLLSPFDPVVRDRARALRLFGFDYRFEAFVPEAKRRYGYFVLPILEGEELVGRLDAKLERETGTLRVKALYWEPRIRPRRARVRGLRDGLELLSGQLGARDVDAAMLGR